MYKGYFVPLPADPTLECNTPKSDPPTTSKPDGAASWQDPPARISSSGAKVQPGSPPIKNTSKKDVEEFDPNDSKAKANVTQNVQSNPENYEPSNINIEIHNVFTFGNDPTKNATQENKLI